MYVCMYVERKKKREKCRKSDYPAPQLCTGKYIKNDFIMFCVLVFYLQCVGNAVGDVHPQPLAAVALLGGDAADRPGDSQQVGLDTTRKRCVYIGMADGGLKTRTTAIVRCRARLS